MDNEDMPENFIGSIDLSPLDQLRFQTGDRSIQVFNSVGNQLGELHRETAVPLWQILHRKLASLDGRVLHTKVTEKYRVPVEVLLYCKDMNIEKVDNILGEYGITLNGSILVDNDKSINSMETDDDFNVSLSDERLQGKLDRLFEDMQEKTVSGQAEPSEIIKTKLYKHQKEALYWMLEKENSDELPPFWKTQDGSFFNTLTETTTTEKPNSVKCGILADDMGLGKTLVIISLIATNTIENCITSRNGHNASPRECSTGEGNNDDQVPGCSDQSPKHVDKQVRQIDAFTADVHGDSKSESATDFWRNTIRKRKHSETGCSHCGDYSDSIEEPTIFLKMKKKFDKKRNSCLLVGCKKEEKTEFIDNSDSVIVISDEEDSVRCEDKHVQKCENLDDEVDDVPGFMLHKGPTSALEATTNVARLMNSKATLVVCPATVIPTWQGQFETHVHRRNRLKIYIFHGPDRITDIEYLARRDVVLTTYGTVRSDSKRNRSLHGISWHRIVLDEGHEIRNPVTKTAQAIYNLKGGMKWVLSGTPIQNNIQDLWSVVNFLELHPLTDRIWWFRAIERPLRKQTETAFRILGSPWQPGQHESHVNPEDYILILIIELRLRQMCCHPALYPDAKLAVSHIVALRGGIDEDKRRDLVKKLLKVLKSGNVECPICLNDWKSPVITPCKHVFCRQCILDVLNVAPQVNTTCPMCRAPLDARQLVEAKAQDLEPDEQTDISVTNFQHSTKTRALMTSLVKLREDDPSIKSMVVSFFTSFLDIIEVPLRDKGFRFVRIDGKMSLTKRQQAVSSFMKVEPNSPTVILISLKAGGQGITLTAASRVFLMKPWFNPAIEQQCFDRCHRIGQTKEVIITKFIMEDSIQEGLLECQRKKLELMRKAFSKPTLKEKRLQTIQNIRTAFGL